MLELCFSIAYCGPEDEVILLMELTNSILENVCNACCSEWLLSHANNLNSLVVLQLPNGNADHSPYTFPLLNSEDVWELFILLRGSLDYNFTLSLLLVLDVGVLLLWVCLTCHWWLKLLFIRSKSWRMATHWHLIRVLLLQRLFLVIVLVYNHIAIINRWYI